MSNKNGTYEKVKIFLAYFGRCKLALALILFTVPSMPSQVDFP